MGMEEGKDEIGKSRNSWGNMIELKSQYQSLQVQLRRTETRNCVLEDKRSYKKIRRSCDKQNVGCGIKFLKTHRHLRLNWNESTSR